MKNVYKLKLQSIAIKDAGDIVFQCINLKDSYKLSVKEYIFFYLFSFVSQL
jgi:hypothetical protein